MNEPDMSAPETSPVGEAQSPVGISDQATATALADLQQQLTALKDHNQTLIQEKQAALAREREALKKEKDKSSKERLKKIEEELANLQETSRELHARWVTEKEAIANLQGAKEKIESTRIEIEKAERNSDLEKAARLRYGTLRELEDQVAGLEARIL